ncbi:MAG: hypothetical protein A2992_09450 [Elusimicrobia bacterium RIFCSPLOWO2_01_FULL_59_12]|nr:MAG: hypothetical protein A2992_09450 [Elusimicrobia bacterium RIFCSPLOWO2_01_FULL_59_12]
MNTASIANFAMKRNLDYFFNRIKERIAVWQVAKAEQPPAIGHGRKPLPSQARDIFLIIGLAAVVRGIYFRGFGEPLPGPEISGTADLRRWRCGNAGDLNGAYEIRSILEIRSRPATTRFTQAGEALSLRAD